MSENFAGRLIITLTAPSGTGKDTLAEELVKRDDSIKFLTTATTRAPRPHEEHGVHYFFLSPEEFREKLEQGEFLEHNDVYHGNMYGTLRSVVEDHFNTGDDVISDINWVGVRQIKHKMPAHSLSILILPPSVEELERRLRTRQGHTKETEESLHARLEKMRDDIKFIDDPDYVFTNPDLIGSRVGDYDYIVINDNLESAVGELLEIVSKERIIRG